MGSRGTLEHIVEGTFRALLICSAVYFGAKYAPYVLHIADNVKEKIIPGSSHRSNNLQQAYTTPNELKEIPAALADSDPRLYNAIIVNRYVDDWSRRK